MLLNKKLRWASSAKIVAADGKQQIGSVLELEVPDDVVQQLGDGFSLYIITTIVDDGQIKFTPLVSDSGKTQLIADGNDGKAYYGISRR